MTIVLIPHPANQSASCCRSSVKVRNVRTDCSSRSGPTAAHAWWRQYRLPPRLSDIGGPFCVPIDKPMPNRLKIHPIPMEGPNLHYYQITIASGQAEFLCDLDVLRLSRIRRLTKYPYSCIIPGNICHRKGRQATLS